MNLQLILSKNVVLLSFPRGVILMRLEYAGKIQSASLISATETETDEFDASYEVNSGKVAL